MQALWKNIVGDKLTTFAGIGAILSAIGLFLQTGELNINQIGMAFAGLVGLGSTGGTPE